MAGFVESVDRFFGVTERGSTFKREIMGGVITFLAMLYILSSNPAILSEHTHISEELFFSVTALAAVISCILTGIYAKFPVAMAPGMGINSFVSFTLVYNMGFTYYQALLAVLISGLMFFTVSVTGYREKLLRVAPPSFRYAITAGIGIFIALTGVVKTGIVTMVPGIGPQFPIPFSMAQGMAVFCIVITLLMYFKRYWFATIAGIVITAVLGLLTGTTSLPDSVFCMPDFSLVGDVFSEFTMFDSSLIPSFIIGTISLFMIDTFDSAGTLLAIGETSGMTDEKGDFTEGAGKTLIVDSGATALSAVLGTSSTTAYVESQVGIESGARTGLMPVVTGILFLLTLFMYPVFSIITPECTVGALLLVGILMMGSIRDIEWKDPVVAVTAFLTMFFMVFSYSISNGIGFGVIAYVLGMYLTHRPEKVSKGMAVLAIVFAVYFMLYYAVLPLLY